MTELNECPVLNQYILQQNIDNNFFDLVDGKEMSITLGQMPNIYGRNKFFRDRKKYLNEIIISETIQLRCVDELYSVEFANRLHNIMLVIAEKIVENKFFAIGNMNITANQYNELSSNTHLFAAIYEPYTEFAFDFSYKTTNAFATITANYILLQRDEFLTTIHKEDELFLL